MIRFFIRAVFWLSVIVLFLPADPERGSDAPRVTFFDGISAVRATVADLSRFCERNPDVCDTGNSALQVMASKAGYGVRRLQEYLTDDTPAGPADPATGTLTPADAAVPWEGDRRDGRA